MQSDTNDTNNKRQLCALVCANAIYRMPNSRIFYGVVLRSKKIRLFIGQPGQPGQPDAPPNQPPVPVTEPPQNPDPEDVPLEIPPPESPEVYPNPQKKPPPLITPSVH